MPRQHLLACTLLTAAGSFPTRLKDAKIVPIFKNKGEISLLTNFRPISLVNYLPKVFKKLVIGRLGKRLESTGFSHLLNSIFENANLLN